MADQLVLDLETITVHCFACPHVVLGATPDAAHDDMERHYEARHRLLIAGIVGDLGHA